ncbi:GNAT family N-acetyltransferase [Mesorhizobium sp. B4-1-4]|uniref:GNAT family N-acetyltransferase n=1 Tax=Mesorhizobium sp. B4-1-4 TaxID=2589888 RepID=UPI00112C4538|nr:GNAT family N-acetyltransferase [Mesorhizobium sp. B4-1-4]UCI29358.1 GNAT family N-acetyltransferase [Mesorhizobium sp. B4-1-4]
MNQAQFEATGSAPIPQPRHVAGTGLQVTWFGQWNVRLDDALSRLPASDACPHGLFRLLASNTIGHRKRIALVHEENTPVAIAALRRTPDERWVPVTHYIVPGFVLPSQPGRVLDAVASLGVTVDLGFWRSEQGPQSHGAVRRFWSEPSFGMDTADDFEAYWRKTGELYSIRAARRKCGGFSVGLNQPGAAELIIEEWGEAWGVDRDEIADRVAAAEYMENDGRLVSILLMDEDRKVGGITCIIHDDELVHGVPFRNHHYDKFGVGKYIFYLVFEVARKLNLKAVDLGGGHAYKRRFAPTKGSKYEMRVCGNVVRYQFDRAMRRLHRATHAGRPAGHMEQPGREMGSV